MDADCLIKLVKVSLKETLVGAFTILIPSEVAEESAAARLASSHPDSLLIQRNVAGGRILVQRKKTDSLRQTELDLSGLGAGERSLLELYAAGHTDTIATDDRRLLRVLRSLGVPRASSASLLVLLHRTGAITRRVALQKLALLSAVVSREEHANAADMLGDR